MEHYEGDSFGWDAASNAHRYVAHQAGCKWMQNPSEGHRYIAAVQHVQNDIAAALNTWNESSGKGFVHGQVQELSFKCFLMYVYNSTSETLPLLIHC